MNYYQLLNVDENATTQQIKKHYYQLAKEYHPDKTKGDPIKCEQFKLLSEAYSTLSNPKKRYFYDLKKLLRLNDKFNLNFTEEEYELLHSYYNKMMNLTEIKFIKLLFTSLPQNLKESIKQKLTQILNSHNSNESVNTLIHLQNIKYINIANLKEEYSINLVRNLNDIYNNRSKQILIIGKKNSYHLFITSYNYRLNINNEGYPVTVTIVANLENFTIQDNNLIYTQPINLYQYYYGDYYSITLNSEIIFRNTLDSIQIMPNLGLINYETGIRGNLYIQFKVDLNKHRHLNEDTNKEIINKIFNIS